MVANGTRRRFRTLALGALVMLAGPAGCAGMDDATRNAANRAGDHSSRRGGGSGGSAGRQAVPGAAARRGQPRTVAVPKAAAGHYAVAAGTAKPPAGRTGKVVRYLVEVERGLPFGANAFAADVHRILNHPRGWGHGGRMRFERTDHGPVRVRVALSSPDLTDRLCLPRHTGGELSCWDGPRSVINAKRWGTGARTYGRDLASYREYVINHEVGHQLYGPEHASCPKPGAAAPVMVQQSISLYGCRPNPWPFPDRPAS